MSPHVLWASLPTLEERVSKVGLLWFQSYLYYLLASVSQTPCGEVRPVECGQKGVLLWDLPCGVFPPLHLAKMESTVNANLVASKWKAPQFPGKNVVWPLVIPSLDFRWVKRTCMALIHCDLGGLLSQRSQLHTPSFSAFLSILANENTSLAAPEETQEKAMPSLLPFVPLQISDWLFHTPQEKQWNVWKDHRMLISNKQRIITTITVIALMAIIININLSSGEPWMVFGGPRAIMTRAWLGPAVGFSEAKRGTQASKPSAQWNITSFSLLLFTSSQWRSVRAKAFCRASQNENAWCRTALTGDQQAGIIKSVISPACSLELGHMVELFRLMKKKKIPHNFRKMVTPY